jgi:glycosyltransferase involved in cell wall biosynthesis
LPFELAKTKIDLIHYPHFNSPILYPKRSVCTIHDITPFHFPGHRMKSNLRRWGYNQVFRSTVRKAHSIIAISNSTKQAMVKTFNLPENKVKVVYEGVDERFQIIENHATIKEVKIFYGISKPFIFYVGVWRNHKNLEGLIKAFNILKNDHQIEHQLVLGGQEDPHYPKIRQTINQSPFKNDIITPGFIASKDLPALYNAAQVFVVPSFIEGFGLIGVEAQSCGIPVASSNTTSMPEVLGEAAIYFDPHNIQEMAQRISQILHNPELRKDLRNKGLANIQRFSWQNCAKQTLAIYRAASR